MPVDKEVIENVATPDERVPVPRLVPESAKVTVPVGTPPEDATVAVSTTVVPCKAGFGDTVRTVVVVTEEDPPPCEEDPLEQPCNSTTLKQTKTVALPIDDNFMKCPSFPNLFCVDKHMPRMVVPSNFVWKTNESRFPEVVAEGMSRGDFRPIGRIESLVRTDKTLKDSMSGHSNRIISL